MTIYGFPIKSGHLPWALLVLHVLLGNSIVSDLVGVATGHTYIYLKMVLPESHGYDLVKTPNWITNFTNKLISWSNGG